MTDLNVCYIVADKTDEWFRLSVEQAALVADRFVFVVDRPDDFTWDVIEKAQALKPTVILHSRYRNESKKADGLYRNVYLDWLKRNALDEWALVLDTDEILGDECQTIKRFMLEKDIHAYDVRMRHVWWTLSTEDASVQPHRVAKRFFRVQIGLHYPLVEHPILEGADSLPLDDIQIWHFNVVKGVLCEIAKYKKQCWKSNIHSPAQLAQWHAMHVLGQTQIVKPFSAGELPKIVREFACIDENGQPVFHQVEEVKESEESAD